MSYVRFGYETFRDIRIRFLEARCVRCCRYGRAFVFTPLLARTLCRGLFGFPIWFARVLV